MTHDPHQAYPTFGTYMGLTNPLSSPYTNPQAFASNPAAAIQQMNPYSFAGISPQLLQLAPALAGQQGQFAGQPPVWQNPFSFQNAIGQNPFAQNPLAAAVLQNSLIAAAVQNAITSNPLLAQIALQPYAQYGQQYQQPYQQQSYQQQPYQQAGHAVPLYGQQISPFTQLGSPLAPQSWVGQGLTGHPGQLGQMQFNPLFLQSAARAIQGQGMSPWGGAF